MSASTVSQLDDRRTLVKVSSSFPAELLPLLERANLRPSHDGEPVKGFLVDGSKDCWEEFKKAKSLRVPLACIRKGPLPYLPAGWEWRPSAKLQNFWVAVQAKHPGFNPEPDDPGEWILSWDDRLLPAGEEQKLYKKKERPWRPETWVRVGQLRFLPTWLLDDPRFVYLRRTRKVEPYFHQPRPGQWVEAASEPETQTYSPRKKIWLPPHPGELNKTFLTGREMLARIPWEQSFQLSVAGWPLWAVPVTYLLWLASGGEFTGREAPKAYFLRPAQLLRGTGRWLTDEYREGDRCPLRLATPSPVITWKEVREYGSGNMVAYDPIPGQAVSDPNLKSYRYVPQVIVRRVPVADITNIPLPNLPQLWEGTQKFGPLYATLLRGLVTYLNSAEGQAQLEELDERHQLRPDNYQDSSLWREWSPRGCWTGNPVWISPGTIKDIAQEDLKKPEEWAAFKKFTQRAQVRILGSQREVARIWEPEIHEGYTETLYAPPFEHQHFFFRDLGQVELEPLFQSFPLAPLCPPVWVQKGWGCCRETLEYQPVLSRKRRRGGKFAAGYTSHALYQGNDTSPRLPTLFSFHCGEWLEDEEAYCQIVPERNWAEETVTVSYPGVFYQPWGSAHGNPLYLSNGRPRTKAQRLQQAAISEDIDPTPGEWRLGLVDTTGGGTRIRDLYPSFAAEEEDANWELLPEVTVRRLVLKVWEHPDTGEEVPYWIESGRQFPTPGIPDEEEEAEVEALKILSRWQERFQQLRDRWVRAWEALSRPGSDREAFHQERQEALDQLDTIQEYLRVDVLGWIDSDNPLRRDALQTLQEARQAIRDGGMAEEEFPPLPEDLDPSLVKLQLLTQMTRGWFDREGKLRPHFRKFLRFRRERGKKTSLPWGRTLARRWQCN